MCKKLLILGGSAIMSDVVAKAREMGVYTIVTDWYDTKRSPAKLLADEYWDVSIEDYDTLSRLISERSIDGVFTGFTDSYLLPYRHICEMNNLPCYGTREQFETFINKDLYKELCRKYNVPTIEQYALASENIQYPVIIKPVDGSGSRGIVVCHNYDEMAAAAQACASSSRCGRYVIERYMDGLEVTVFWLFVDGQYHLMGIGNRHVKRNQGTDVIPLPVGYTFPSVFTPKYITDVVPNAKRMFEAAGIRNGMMFMQCKVEDGICYVYDIGYRLTGSLEYKIFDKVAGYNPLEMLIRFALTGKMTEDSLERKIDPVHIKPCYNVSCLCAPGTIKEISGIDKALGLPGVIDAKLNHFPGQTITEGMKGQLTQIALRALGSVDSKDELYPQMKRIEECISIKSEDGTELMLPGIEKEDIEGYVI